MLNYEPLRILLVKEKLNLKSLTRAGVLTPNNSVILNNDTGYVSLKTLDGVLNHLSRELGRIITLDDIIEFVPDKPTTPQKE
ncbi:MAG TPA: hypothetical protein GX707_06270 [Epulopiscium sp.]|nr:hypothetical protein [Candidatus Epulonipiscium sp.]